MTAFERRTFARDLRACLALSDARKAENAAIRERLQQNPALRALLREEAERRGEPEIDWTGYFSRLGVL